MRTKKKIWLACGIPLGLIGGLFLWLALWANHWENRWETFKRDAEAQGESFVIESDAKTQVPDEENFLKHPWVKSVWHGNKPSDADTNNIRLLLETKRGKRGKKPTPLKSPEEWLSESKLLLDSYRSDLQQMHESSQRPACWRDVSTLQQSSEGQSLLFLRFWVDVLELQYWWHAQLEDRPRMREDVKILLQIAEHARKDPLALSQLLALFIENRVNQVIQTDLDSTALDPEQKKLWLEILSQHKLWSDEEIITTLRLERNLGLHMLTKREIQDDLFSRGSELKELWQKNIFVRRALLANCRVAICEDLQVTVISPYMKSKKIEKRNFDEYFNAVERRANDKSSSTAIFEFWDSGFSLYTKIEEVTTARNALIQQLFPTP